MPALRLGFRRGLLLLEAPCGGQLPGSCSLTDRVAEAVSRLPELTRRADVGAAAGRLHDSQLCLGATPRAAEAEAAGQGAATGAGLGARGGGDEAQSADLAMSTAGAGAEAGGVGPGVGAGVGPGAGREWQLTGFGSFIADPSPARQGLALSSSLNLNSNPNTGGGAATCAGRSSSSMGGGAEPTLQTTVPTPSSQDRKSVV